MNKKDLYIPVNVIDREDFIAGFGGREMMITGVVLVIAVVMGVVRYFQTEGIVLSVLFPFLMTGLTISLVMRDKYDESMIDKLKLVVKHKRSQKRFAYCYYDANGNGETEDEERE